MDVLKIEKGMDIGIIFIPWQHLCMKIRNVKGMWLLWWEWK